MQAGTETDAALILASSQGDRDAFARIIERYQRAVYAVAFSGLRDRALADDTTQDTFVTAWRRLDELRESERLGAWLCGIARNLARDVRKRYRRETSNDGVDSICATTPFEELSEAESERMVATALGQVPDVYREPLVLYYYEERSIDDVARSLGISTATTNKRLSRGRRYLADRVATVERGLVRRGPHPGLAAAVLAAIVVTVPASHVDASTPVKGSTMNKLSLAAIITVSLGGAGAVAITIAQGDDAHARSTHIDPLAATRDVSRNAGATAVTGGERRAGDVAALPAARRLPALLGMPDTRRATGGEAKDCAAVAKYLAELEADTTHGPNHRPDDETSTQCASHFQTRCESDGWSEELRDCVLAAGDLINAHMCASGAKAGQKTSDVPPALVCTKVGPHVAATLQSAGFHKDVADLEAQVVAACETGGWPTPLRQCLAGAESVDALKACIKPH